MTSGTFISINKQNDRVDLRFLICNSWSYSAHTVKCAWFKSKSNSSQLPAETEITWNSWKKQELAN